LVQRLGYCHAVPAVYDLSLDPAQQGLASLSFDIVVAHQVLHTSSDIHKCMANVASLIVPGGFLLATELDGAAWKQATPGSIWHDWVFGSFAEWFGCSDGRMHPSMSETAWAECLHKVGFAQTEVSTEEGGGIGMLLVSQRLQSPSSLTFRTPSLPMVTFTYRKGEESSLKAFLSNKDVAQPLTVLLLSAPGPDANAAHGLVATLNHEYPVWRVRLVISTRKEQCFQDPSPFILALLENEHVVHVDADDSTQVLRLAPIPRAAADAGMQQFLPDEHILIEMIQHVPCLGFFSFSGRVIKSRSRTIIPGHYAIGITTSSCSSPHVIVPASWLLSHPDEETLSRCNPFVAVLVSLLKNRTLYRSTHASRSPLRVLPLLSDSALHQDLESFLRSSMRSFTFVDVKSASPGQVDVLLTDTQMIQQSLHMQRSLSRKGHTIVWDADLHSMIHLERFDMAQAVSESYNIPRPIFPTISTQDFAPKSLFRSDCTYLLAGGLSSLGVHLAIWLYEVRI
jgi:hypothetical protein